MLCGPLPRQGGGIGWTAQSYQQNAACRFAAAAVTATLAALGSSQRRGLIQGTTDIDVAHNLTANQECFCWLLPAVQLPNTPGASRVLAKLLRRWMPPSATWLFPPRADSHDRCSWLMEWEGFNTQHRPGWMHPAVFVLTAAFYSADMEARRLSRQPGPLQEWLAELSGRAVSAATQAWAACRQLLQRLQLI